LEAALFAEHVRPNVERIAEERLQRLEQPARRGRVGVDHRLDGLLPRVRGFHLHAKWLELARDGTALAVVREIRIDRRPPNDARAVAPDVEDRRHRRAGKRVDRQHGRALAVPDSDRRVGGPKVEAEAQGRPVSQEVLVVGTLTTMLVGSIQKRMASGHRPVYVISIAAGLAGCHPRTLRIYEEEGLLEPVRTETNIRLYSDDDLQRVRVIRYLTQVRGVNLAGVKLLLHMRDATDLMEDLIR